MVIAAAVLLNLFFRIIRLPLKWLVKAALHAAVGFVALFILNFIGSWIGVELEMNAFNALITGLFAVRSVISYLPKKWNIVYTQVCSCSRVANLVMSAMSVVCMRRWRLLPPKYPTPMSAAPKSSARRVSTDTHFHILTIMPLLYAAPFS